MSLNRIASHGIILTPDNAEIFLQTKKGKKGYFQFEIITNVFHLHSNIYVMGLRPLYIFNTFSEGTYFRGQNLTSLDVRF